MWDGDQTIEAVLMEYLKRQDPVEKAKRRLASQRKVADQNNVAHENTEGDALPVQSSAGKHRAKRIRLKARQKHAVHNRDQGRCTYVDANGWQCTKDRGLHIHHVRPVSEGGSNDPKNLRTLCAFHHDLAHQLSLPIDFGENVIASFEPS